MSYALFPCWVSFQLGKHPISFCSRRSEPRFPASRLELLHQSPLWKSCLSSPETGAPMSHGEVFLPWIAVAVVPIRAPNWCCLVLNHHKPSHLRVKKSKYWFFTVCWASPDYVCCSIELLSGFRRGTLAIKEGTDELRVLGSYFMASVGRDSSSADANPKAKREHDEPMNHRIYGPIFLKEIT